MRRACRHGFLVEETFWHEEGGWLKFYRCLHCGDLVDRVALLAGLERTIRDRYSLGRWGNLEGPYEGSDEDAWPD